MTHDAQIPQAREQTKAVTARFGDDSGVKRTFNAPTRKTSSTRWEPSGCLAAMIPTEYGGHGWGIGAASAVMAEINASGGHSAACRAQMYTMGAVLRHRPSRSRRSPGPTPSGSKRWPSVTGMTI